MRNVLEMKEVNYKKWQAAYLITACFCVKIYIGLSTIIFTYSRLDNIKNL